MKTIWLFMSDSSSFRLQFRPVVDPPKAVIADESKADIFFDVSWNND
jgi:hypothetical protein